jgi:hypothetical protein
MIFLINRDYLAKHDSQMDIKYVFCEIGIELLCHLGDFRFQTVKNGFDPTSVYINCGSLRCDTM